MNVVLISTYELGHQPFGLASPAAWLKDAGASVTCMDLAVQPLDPTLIATANLIAVYLPMHTATSLAVPVIKRVKRIQPEAHLCAYGLYAPLNETYLRRLGVQTILGGEFEEGLVALYQHLTTRTPESITITTISLNRQQFKRPDRTGLPGLNEYAWLDIDGQRRVVGYTEASRGCQHHCRHCPIVPVYNGRFRIVQPEIVLADIRQQVAAGAQHITFGDPDFFNGPGHALPLVTALHHEYPELTYDVTIKIEHLLKYDHHLPLLRHTGCLFVTSAVEAVDDRILDLFDKGHTRSDFVRVVARMQQVGLALNPTFVSFTPWTSIQGYIDMLALVDELDLVDYVSPIQYAIRLLIPAGSKLLTLPSIQEVVPAFDEARLSYPWHHPDTAVDKLYEDVFRLVKAGQKAGMLRRHLFEHIWQKATAYLPDDDFVVPHRRPAVAVPTLSEDWY